MSVSIIMDGFGASHDPMLSFLNRARPDSSIVINEKEKLCNVAAQFTKPFFRNVNDDNLFNRHDFNAREWTHDLAWGLVPKCGLYLGNEPGYSPTLIEKTCDAMEVCIELNRSAYLFNFAVFHPPDFFYDDLRNHARFNDLYSRGDFFICWHDYYPTTIAQGVSDGAILRPLWFRLAQHYQCAVTEWGYAANYDPHAGWFGRVSEVEYISQLNLYINNPDFKRHNFPIHVFIWNPWHDFEVMYARQFQDNIVQLNTGETDMLRVVAPRPGMKFHLRMGKGTQFPSLGIVDLDNMPVQLLEFLDDEFYKLYVPALDKTGFMYQSGNASLGKLGLRKI